MYVSSSFSNYVYSPLFYFYDEVFNKRLVYFEPIIYCKFVVWWAKNSYEEFVLWFFLTYQLNDLIELLNFLSDPRNSYTLIEILHVFSHPSTISIKDICMLAIWGQVNSNEECYFTR